MRAIRAKNVSYRYPDGTVGVRDVSIEIEIGERVGIVGANGSGKSTLLFLLAGLLTPERGEIEILGMKVEKKNFEKIRRNVGIAFQNPDDFLFNPSVRDELLYVPLQLGWEEKRIEEAIRKYSELFSINNILHRPPFRLSGGEKKKVEIASILIYEPEILLLDEPTANVDGKSKRVILRLLEDFNGTLVIASHEIEIIKRLCNRVILLNPNHSIEADGGIELLENAELMERIGVL
ncbi:MAG: cobalt/nickel transport system ATP-binding protein [Archaeoglobi archaeon]|nr:cobalt/nickel transport system ATP-binding protein [Archaeoglobi archaeon]